MSNDSKALHCLLSELISAEQWVNPSTSKIRRNAPFVNDPLVFLTGYEIMIFESRSLMGDEELENSVFHEYLGFQFEDVRSLPWLDVDRSLFIAVNENPRDDVGFALDFRTSSTGPRVVADEWVDGGCVWKRVASTFSSFVFRLELLKSQPYEDPTQFDSNVLLSMKVCI
jgi:hypothetical protein